MYVRFQQSLDRRDRSGHDCFSFARMHFDDVLSQASTDSLQLDVVHANLLSAKYGFANDTGQSGQQGDGATGLLSLFANRFNLKTQFGRLQR